MSINVTQIRSAVVELLDVHGFQLETAAGSDFTRDGKTRQKSDVEISIGTSYGEVTIRAKTKTHIETRRITRKSQLDLVLTDVSGWIREANARGRVEGWL